MWYTQVRGNDPQTGQEVQDEWACAITWIPILQINIAQQVRQGSAATEGVRNQISTVLGQVVQTQFALNAMANGVATNKLENT